MNNQIANGIYRINIDETVLRDGAWHKTGATSVYLVESQSKLASIPDAAPGDIAYTAGYEYMWQLDTDGTTWVSVGLDVQEGLGPIMALRHVSSI